MSAERFQRLEDIFHRALRLDGEERDHFVRACAAGDEELYREAMELVSAHGPDVLSPGGMLGSSPRARSAIDLPPIVETAGARYQILDILGEGGMGVVFLAQQERPIRRRVALKIIKIGIDSKRAAARFEVERQALALMSHPHIARVYEAGTSNDGRLYFAMEFVPGQPIGESCDTARLPIRDRLRLFIDVCDAVHHAHQKGIIHRDLKPSNVLVARENGSFAPKVIDFGVARSLNQRLTEHTAVTQLGVIVGSFAYMSPEQADCRVLEVDTRSDIYSLGALLYELLVGATPLDMSDLAEVGYVRLQRRVIEDEPLRPSARLAADASLAARAAEQRSTPPAALMRALRGDLDWIVMKAVDKDRACRYASASELAVDLRRHLEHRTISAGRPTPAYRFRKYFRRNRASVIATAAVTAALFIGLGTTSALWIKNRESAALARAQRDEILRLSDVKLLEAATAQADLLYPSHPEKIDAMAAWLAGPAADLAGRVSIHRATLAALESRGTSVVEIGTSRRVFDDPELQFQYDVLSELLQDLDRFFDPNPYVGTVASVRSRLGFAETVYRRSIVEHAQDWNAAIASIADLAACPQYRGLVVTPQVGLVPIGRDPASGLWEFAHLESGEPPLRDAHGRLVMEDGSSIVLVLLPGGCYWMGAMRKRVDTRDYWSGNPDVRPDEEPPHRVCLDPFFMSKFEMTQGQWLRITGANPTREFPHAGAHYDQPLRCAVEGVNWSDADRVARQLGMELPTEAQWEYAARAGTASEYACGDDPDCVKQIANMRTRPAKDPEHITPVGKFRANAFGLHDVSGNVWEWCRDAAGSYELPVAPGNGLRLGTTSNERIMRGEGFASWYPGYHITWRGDVPPTNRDSLGLRPARPLDRGKPVNSI